MKCFLCIVLLSLYFSITGCNHPSKATQSLPDTLSKPHVYSNEIDNVSLITLIANPKQFDGHKVRVIGYLNLEFEGNGIFVHKEDYDQGIPKNALWVEMDRDSAQLPGVKLCVKKNVLMEGTFDANNQGHFGAFSGAIKDITRLELWNVLPKPVENKHQVRFPSIHSK